MPLRADLLRDLGLVSDNDTAIGDDRDAFLTIRCRDSAGRPFVLKCVNGDSPDAFRRLANEALLFAHLPVRPPLRLLLARDAGPGFLVTHLDGGTVLRPQQVADDDRVLTAVVEALVQFQSIQIDRRQVRVADREHLATYYLKSLLKHIVHLWPAHLTAGEAAACATIVSGALPAILRRRVICHGDFLPTNLLYHPDDGSVTFTDLEGFMNGNHPLFDVLALVTTSEDDLAEWTWQTMFVREYLRRAAKTLSLDPASPELWTAYRGLLVFFLVFQLNDRRLLLRNAPYFDGKGKADYVKAKVAAVIRRRDARREDDLRPALETRSRNLRRVLSRASYREHVQMVRAGL